MLLLFVTFVHKGKRRAAACRRRDLSEHLHFYFNQELVVTATCGGFFRRRRDVLWLMRIKSGSQPCVLLKCPWASFWIPNSCENAVLCLNFDLWPLSVEKRGRVRTFFLFLCNQIVIVHFSSDISALNYTTWVSCTSKVRWKRRHKDACRYFQKHRAEQSQTVPDKNCPLAYTSSYLSWYQGHYQRETPSTKESWALWENSDGTSSTSRESLNLFCVP